MIRSARSPTATSAATTSPCFPENVTQAPDSVEGVLDLLGGGQRAVRRTAVAGGGDGTAGAAVCGQGNQPGGPGGLWMSGS